MTCVYKWIIPALCFLLLLFVSPAGALAAAAEAVATGATAAEATAAGAAATADAVAAAEEGTGLSFSAGIGEVNDGVDFIGLLDNLILMGKYKHVSSVTFLRPRPTASSWTQPPTAYEEKAEAILWRVMGEEEEDGALTLLSEYVIDSRRFHSTDRWLDYNYLKSEIRAWLNGPFLQNAFSAVEYRALLETNVVQKMWDPEKNDWVSGSFTALWGRANPSEHTTVFPKIARHDKVYLPWREYASTVFHWDAGNLSSEAYRISGEAAQVRLRNQMTETDTGNDIRALSRSPMPESSNHILPASDTVYSDGNYTVSSYGIRPIIKLDPARVLYAEKQEEHFCFTLLDEEIALLPIAANGKAVAPGDRLSLLDKKNLIIETLAPGRQTLAYKVVRDKDGAREIVAHGAGAADKVTIPLLKQGDYALYIWAQNDEAPVAGGSYPLFCRLSIYTEPLKRSKPETGTASITQSMGAALLGRKDDRS